MENQNFKPDGAGKKSKILLFALLAFDILLLVTCILQIVWPRVSFNNSSFLNPKGLIAQQERALIVKAVLIMLIGTIPVYILIFFFAWKYRADRTETKYSPDLEGKALGGIALWALPALIILALSVINWKSTHLLDPSNTIASGVPPITIEVVALQWKFLFIYPKQNIATVNFIEFPQGTPLNFELTADAPMSSFWIPQLGSQIYAMAGMQTHLNLIADQPGDFKGMDTEINGTGFSGMKFIARSTSRADFDQWVASVKQSGAKLNLDDYNQLAEPSQNNPQAYYSSVDPGLYDTIMMKNMMPMTQARMEQMSSLGLGAANSSATTMPGMNMGSSSPMNMQGMDMK